MCLVFTAWACLATSILGDSINDGAIYVNSDCTSPASEMSVTVSGGQIIAPGGVSYTDFGFPQSTVTLNAPVSGVVGSATRVCDDTYTDSDDVHHIFTCKDDGSYACTILITEQ